ncbi:transmembrane protein 163-like [Sinocyclocheilus grahami]|uniref:transmembrane protein 163-like n=1 Tax=Sinocyclocheilus grahami TaxID=75366 RepID=UPI0007ACB5FC|nr:PREDICTED: transmembrane protein 163-like [Sinocyclocheilus grahami]
MNRFKAVSIMRHSASAFGFAFDAILDVLSSIIVIWRYSNAAAVHSAHREYIACAILGVVFILSAITILVKAIHDLATKLQPEVDDFLYSVSVISGVVCAILSVCKFMLGKVLTSRALITDVPWQRVWSDFTLTPPILISDQLEEAGFHT